MSAFGTKRTSVDTRRRLSELYVTFDERLNVLTLIDVSVVFLPGAADAAA
jgi:hypothetical protein